MIAITTVEVVLPPPLPLPLPLPLVCDPVGFVVDSAWAGSAAKLAARLRAMMATADDLRMMDSDEVWWRESLPAAATMTAGNRRSGCGIDGKIVAADSEPGLEAGLNSV